MKNNVHLVWKCENHMPRCCWPPGFDLTNKIGILNIFDSRCSFIGTCSCFLMGYKVTCPNTILLDQFFKDKQYSDECKVYNIIKFFKNKFDFFFNQISRPLITKLSKEPVEKKINLFHTNFRMY